MPKKPPAKTKSRASLVLVTGATGRLGRLLVGRLLERKRYQNKLRLLVFPGENEKARSLFGSRVQVVEHDLLADDFIGLAEACNGISSVVHLAGLVDYGASEQVLMKANYEATLRLVMAAELKHVQRFVFVSSTSIYRGVKLAEGDWINEHTLPAPTNAYGRSKLLAEKALEHSRLDYIIIRPPIVYGPGFTPGFSLVAHLLKKARLPFIGNAENHVAFIHVNDLVQALVLALECKNGRQSFIVTSGEQLTQKELLTGFANALGVPPPRRHVSFSVASHAFSLLAWKDRLLGKRQRFYKEYLHTLCEERRYDISKAKKGLGFHPAVSFKEGVRRFVHFLKRER